MSKFECNRCGKCCTLFDKTGPFITPLEKRTILTFISEQNLKEHFGTKTLNTIENILEKNNYIQVVGNKPPKKCIFLKNNNCLIYKVRPFDCRIYPVSIEPKGKKLLVDKDCPLNSVLLNQLERHNYPEFLKNEINGIDEFEVHSSYFFDNKMKAYDR